jgi:hypothetical protein
MPGHEKKNITRIQNIEKYSSFKTPVLYAVRIFLCSILNKMVSDTSVPVEEFWNLPRRHLKYLPFKNVSLEPECSFSQEENTHIYKILSLSLTHTHTYTQAHK